MPLKAPRGSPSGPFVVIDSEALAEATKSQRLHNFVNVGTVQIDPGCYLKSKPVNLSATLLLKTDTVIASLPNYVRRHSRNDYRRRVGNDKALLGNFADDRLHYLFTNKATAKATKKTSQLKGLTHKVPNQRPVISKIDAAGRIKQELVQSPTESDSSSEESESEVSDSDLEISEPPPLPDKRPDMPLDAVRYDTIKAVWASPNRNANGDEIRTGLKDFWEVVRTIRDRWKSDGNALKQAEEAKKSSELPLLKDRVNSQRIMMQSSIRAALEFGHRDILAL